LYIKIKLKKHQEKGVKYMKKSNARGILLYHGLGSGKTIKYLLFHQLL